MSSPGAHARGEDVEREAEGESGEFGGGRRPPETHQGGPGATGLGISASGGSGMVGAGGGGSGGGAGPRRVGRVGE